MQTQNQKSSTARIVSIIVFLGIIPVWVFYLGMRYSETMSVLTAKDQQLNLYLNK